MNNKNISESSAEKRARELVSQLTLDEVISQLDCVSPEIPRLNIPQYVWWNEALHGVARAGTATVFPQSIGLAAMFDTEMTRKVGEIIALEGRAKYNTYSSHGLRGTYRGLTYWSPNINIFRDPRWGRGHETYGEDPFLTAETGKAFVRGVQTEKDGVMCAAACAKHFAVHSGPEGKRHGFNAVVNKKDLEETYLYAFEELVRSAHVEGVMGAYNRVNGQPCCCSDILRDKLREWNFDGYFTSDAGAMADIPDKSGHHYTESGSETAVECLKHGCDTECWSSFYKTLKESVETGSITEEEVREACVHLFRTRFRLGLFDEKTPFDDIPYNSVACREHVGISRKCAENSIVLLHNDGILPLKEERYKNIAVVGPTADSVSVLLGNYNGTPNRPVTLLAGIQQRFGGNILYSPGCHLFRDNDSNNRLDLTPRFEEAVICAENSDLIIACVGLDATLEGEQGDACNAFSSGDKLDLRLPFPQRRLLNALADTGKPMIVVCTSGSSINTEIKGNALLQVFYPGQSGGEALAEILFGDLSPSGKLPVTFYETVEKLPDFEDYGMKNRTYRYTQDNVLYPFGFGLGYGRTEMTGLEYMNGTACVKIRNCGSIPVREVVQLYIHKNIPEDRTYYSLCGFSSVFLEAGEEKELMIEVAGKSLTAVNDDGIRTAPAASFTLYAGTHAPDDLSCRLSGTECLKIEADGADRA